MLNLLNWDKPIRVNGVVYASSQAAYTALKNFKGEVKIELNFSECNNTTEVERIAQNSKEQGRQVAATVVSDENTYKIKVRQYMTKPSTSQFDFHKKYNNDIPMPMRIMVGQKLEETRGMVKMRLHAKPMPSAICMHCGRTLTNKVSTLYGIGPECGGHNNINPFDSEQELNAHWEELRQKMAYITWEGWIIKSAIEETEIIDE
jgi:hypothetical protein